MNAESLRYAHRMEDERVSAIARELERTREVVLAYLFGSVARGEAGPGSDIDVAVALEPGIHNRLRFRARLAESLSRSSGSTVQVVDLAEATPALGGRIVRDGTLLVCRDDTIRVRTEVHLLQREFDTAPLRRALDRAQSAAIKARSADG